MTSLLLVEDEEHIARALQFNLEAEGFTVESVGDAESALDLLLVQRKHYDLLLLDVMLPGKDGFEAAAELRQASHFIPILMLTARGRPEDVLNGFASGADDYLPKPFELRILLARMNSLLRRRQWMADPAPAVPVVDQFSFAGKTIDFSALEIRCGDQVLPMTVMEADLLRYLVRNAGRPVSRKEILEQVWGMRDDTDTRAIDNFVVRLRRYIEPTPSAPRHVLTVRGVGYKFVAEPNGNGQ